MPEPFRIALLLPTLNMGGAERVAITLAGFFRDAGYAVDFVLLSDEGELRREAPDGSRIIGLGGVRFRGAYGPLVRYFREARPEAVLVFMWPLTVIALLAHRRAGLPGRIVISEHNTISVEQRRRGIWMYLLVRLTTALSYRAADARVCVSRGVAEDVARTSGLPRAAFVVIENPVPPIDEGVADEAVWTVPPGRRILTVGRLAEQKNHALLVRAFAQLSDLGGAQLVILGEGPLRQATEKLIGELGLESRVLLPGATPFPQAYYATADLFALSSDYEGFGMVLIEALGHGLAVVSTDCPSGPAEIITDRSLGTLVPCGDVVELAAAMRDALGRRHDPAPARRRYDDFSVARIGPRYLDVLAGTARRRA